MSEIQTLLKLYPDGVEHAYASRFSGLPFSMPSCVASGVGLRLAGMNGGCRLRPPFIQHTMENEIAGTDKITF